MKELSENPTALDLIIASDEALKNEQQVQKNRSEIKELLKEKEQEISEEIIKKLVETGCHRSNLKVNTTILLRTAIVYVHNWNYDVEYRDNDLLISEVENILDRIELSEMNEVFKLIKDVITKEGLR
jgi:nuclear transport factor 2 (NTF2) superfamily protein